MKKKKEKPKPIVGKLMPASQRPGNVGRTQLFVQKKALEKKLRKLDIKYRDTLGKAELWFQCTQRLAAELYTICPHHELFHNGFFSEGTVAIVKKDAEGKSIPNCQFSSVVYAEADKEKLTTVNITELKRKLSREPLPGTVKIKKPLEKEKKE